MAYVSVIIPVYQSANTVAQAIRSVLDQSYKDVEIIVVDDGSTDPLSEVLQQFGDQVTLIRQRNGGVSAARNTAIRQSSGELVAFLDADDFWLPEKLDLQLPRLSQNPRVGIVFGNVYFWSNIRIQQKTYFDLYRPHRGRVLAPLFAHNFIPLLTVLVRRKVLEDVGLFDESIHFAEDYDFLLRVSATDWEFDYIEEPIAVYRISSQQTSRNYSLAAKSLLELKKRKYREYAGLLGQVPRQVLERGLYNKYLRLTLSYMRDGRMVDATQVLAEYLQVRGASFEYVGFRLMLSMPLPIVRAVVRLWDKLRQKPDLGYL